MNVIRNNRGFTIAELVVASAISVILSTIATLAFSMAMDVFIRSLRLMEAETEMLSAMYAVKGAFSQAINVSYGGNTNAAMTVGTPNAYNARDNASASDITLGRLYTTNFNTTTPTATPSTYMIGFALREMNTGYTPGAVNAPHSNFYGTGVYFQAPGLDKSGALYVDQETNSSGTAEGGWVFTSPVDATSMFTRFTEFHVENVSVRNTTTGVISIVNTAAPGTFTGQPVLSADIRMAMRYFTKGKPQVWFWCTRNFMPGGATPNGSCSSALGRANYADIEKKVKIVFSNNSFDRTKYLVERPMGYIYFFKNWSPTVRRDL